MAIKIGDALLKLGVDKRDFDRDMKGLSGAINRHKKAIGIAMVGMGVAAIGAAAASVKAFADMGDEVQKMALRTGFSTEALSELRHAAEISGANLGTLEKGVKRMSGTILDAQDGLETYVRSFRHIGIEVQELDGLNPEEQFLRIAEAIAEVEDPTKRAAIAQDIFGRAGTELLPLFAAGKEGLKDLREEAHKLGIVFDQEAADSAAEFKDSLTRLDGAVNGLKFTLAKELMPAMDAGIPLMTEWARALGPIIENTLNWHAAANKRIKQEKAWQEVNLQRTRALGGLTNEYEKSLDVLESVLYNQDLLTTQAQATIDSMREEIKARGLLTETIVEGNEALEEQNELLEEQQEAYDKTTQMIEETLEAMEYERSVAGQLGVTIEDIIRHLSDMGESNEYIADTLIALGDEQDNVIKVLDAFGLSAIEVAKALGLETEEVIKLEGAYKVLGEQMVSAGKSAAEMKAALRATYEAGGKASEEDILRAKRKEIDERAEERGEAPVYGYAEGGIAMRPMVARIAERGPEAIIPLEKMAGLGVTITGNNFYVREEADINKIGDRLVQQIRLKTGARF